MEYKSLREFRKKVAEAFNAAEDGKVIIIRRRSAGKTVAFRLALEQLKGDRQIATPTISPYEVVDGKLHYIAPPIAPISPHDVVAGVEPTFINYQPTVKTPKVSCCKLAKRCNHWIYDDINGYWFNTRTHEKREED